MNAPPEIRGHAGRFMPMGRIGQSHEVALAALLRFRVRHDRRRRRGRDGGHAAR